MSLIEHLQDIGEDLGRKNVINTSSGLFVSHCAQNLLVRKLVKYCNEHIEGCIASLDDARRELKDIENVYLLEEDQSTQVGYIFPDCKFDKMRFSEGKLLSCRRYIVKDDPRFVSHPNIELNMPHGYTAGFKMNHIRYGVYVHAFEQFFKRLNESERIKRKLKENFPVDMRDYLTRFYRMFKASRYAKNKSVLGLANKYEGRVASYRATNNWIFVIRDGTDIITCYEDMQGLCRAVH